MGFYHLSRNLAPSIVLIRQFVETAAQFHLALALIPTAICRQVALQFAARRSPATHWTRLMQIRCRLEVRLTAQRARPARRTRTGAWLSCHMAPDHMHTRRGALARIEREFAREVAAGR